MKNSPFQKRNRRACSEGWSVRSALITSLSTSTRPRRPHLAGQHGFIEWRRGRRPRPLENIRARCTIAQSAGDLARRKRSHHWRPENANSHQRTGYSTIDGDTGVGRGQRVQGCGHGRTNWRLASGRSPAPIDHHRLAAVATVDSRGSLGRAAAVAADYEEQSAVDSGPSGLHGLCR